MFENWIGPAVENGDIWLDSFTNVAKYGQERDTAKLEIQSSADAITYTLTDQMDDTLFTLPLTVKLKVDNSWENIEALQNGKKLDVKTIELDGSKYVLIDTVPDTGAVVVKPNAGEPTSEDISIMDGVTCYRDGGDITLRSTSDMDVQIYAAVVKTDEAGYEQLQRGQGIRRSAEGRHRTDGYCYTPPPLEEGERAVLLIWQEGTLKPVTKQIEL